MHLERAEQSCFYYERAVPELTSTSGGGRRSALGSFPTLRAMGRLLSSRYLLPALVNMQQADLYLRRLI